MIAKGFKMTFQKHPKFQGLWKILTSKRNDRIFQRLKLIKVNTNLCACYGCGLLGHMIKDCPNTKKRNEKKKFKVRMKINGELLPQK